MEKNLCVGLGIVFLILLFRNEAKEKQAKEKWRATCTVAWLTIVKRHCYPGGSYVDEYEIPNSSRPSYYLELELNADQSMVAPTEKVVRVDIGGALYNTLLNRKTVCIYYQSEKPLSFFIAEEF